MRTPVLLLPTTPSPHHHHTVPEKMASYADYSQDPEGRFYVKDLKKAIVYFQANPNDENPDAIVPGAIVRWAWLSSHQP